MDESPRRHWFWTAAFFGVVYYAIGVIFAVLAAGAGSAQSVFAWRLAAYVVSAIAFLFHVRHEYATARSATVTTALHVATGVALGGFFLAVSAMIRAQAAGVGRMGRYAIALVAWPALTAIPAFVVALAAAALLARTQPRD